MVCAAFCAVTVPPFAKNLSDDSTRFSLRAEQIQIQHDLGLKRGCSGLFGDVQAFAGVKRWNVEQAQTARAIEEIERARKFPEDLEPQHAMSRVAGGSTSSLAQIADGLSRH